MVPGELKSQIDKVWNAFSTGGIANPVVNMIIDQLTRRGSVLTWLLYEVPFADYAPTGPDGLSTGAQVTKLVGVLRDVSSSAVAS